MLYITQQEVCTRTTPWNDTTSPSSLTGICEPANLLPSLYFPTLTKTTWCELGFAAGGLKYVAQKAFKET